MLRFTAYSMAVLFSACSSPGADGSHPTPQPEEPVALDAAALALGYKAGGEIETGIEEAQRLVRARPRDPGAYLGLSRAFLARKRATGDVALLALARDALAAAEAMRPRSPEALALRGVLLQEEHQFSKLADLAGELIDVAPDDSTGYLLLGDAELERGDYEAAIAAYEQAMERYPDLRIYTRGAHIRWLHGDIDGALEMLEDAMSSAGRSREHLAFCFAEVGEIFLARGELDRAVAAAERADQLVAGYPAAARLRARAELARGDLDAAAAAAIAAVSAQTTAADQLVLAEIEEARGNALAAARARSAGLALAGHDPLPAALYLARRGEDPARAVALAEAETETRPNIYADDARALALHRAGRHREAATAIERALRLGTPLAELHLHRGLIAAALGDRAAARRDYARARELNPHADPLLAAELTRALEVTR